MIPKDKTERVFLYIAAKALQIAMVLVVLSIIHIDLGLTDIIIVSFLEDLCIFVSGIILGLIMRATRGPKTN